MSTRDDKARQHAEQHRAEVAIRRIESAMEAEEREMERAMRAFEEDADQAKRFIRDEWRREQFGHELRPPAWEATDDHLNSHPSSTNGKPRSHPAADRTLRR
jgi:hypothetical protein